MSERLDKRGFLHVLFADDGVKFHLQWVGVVINLQEKKMLELLRELKDFHHVTGVKAEFESEGTRIEELHCLLNIARRAEVDVTLKIGGAEAIRDLRDAKKLGVDCIVAPMIETPYALSKYISAITKNFSDEERKCAKFLFNLETLTALENFPDMIKLVAEAPIPVGVVFGRVDFSSSCGIGREQIDSNLMLDYCKRVAEICCKRDVELVIGGGISTNAVEFLQQVNQIRLDRFETRKIIFDSVSLSKPETARSLELAVDFELRWLENKKHYYSGIASEDEDRIDMLKGRIIAR